MLNRQVVRLKYIKFESISLKKSRLDRKKFHSYIFDKQAKAEKLVERHKKEQGAGKEVSMLVHSIPKESSNNSVYLKHPGDEDEDLSEEERNYDDEEQKEDESFKVYIDKHIKETDDKVKKSKSQIK